MVIAEEHKACFHIEKSENQTLEGAVPVVATHDTARERGLPVRPINFGGAISGSDLEIECLVSRLQKIPYKSWRKVTITA